MRSSIPSTLSTAHRPSARHGGMLLCSLGALAICLLLSAAESRAQTPEPLVPCTCTPLSSCYPPSKCSYESRAEANAHQLLDDGVEIAVVAALHGPPWFNVVNNSCTFNAFSSCISDGFDGTLDLHIDGKPGGPVSGYSRVLSLVGPVSVEHSDDPGGSGAVLDAALTNVFAEITPADADPDFSVLQVRVGQAQGLAPSFGRMERTAVDACSVTQKLCNNDSDCVGVDTQVFGTPVPSLPYAIDSTVSGDATVLRMTCNGVMPGSTFAISDLGGGVRGVFLTASMCTFSNGCFGSSLHQQFEDSMGAQLGSTIQQQVTAAWNSACLQSVGDGTTHLPNLELFEDVCVATNNFYGTYGVTYEISWVGASGSAFDGLSDTFTSTARMEVGRPLRTTPTLGPGSTAWLFLLLLAIGVAVTIDATRRLRRSRTDT